MYRDEERVRWRLWEYWRKRKRVEEDSVPNPLINAWWEHERYWRKRERRLRKKRLVDLQEWEGNRCGLGCVQSNSKSPKSSTAGHFCQLTCGYVVLQNFECTRSNGGCVNSSSLIFLVIIYMEIWDAFLLNLSRQMPVRLVKKPPLFECTEK